MIKIYQKNKGFTIVEIMINLGIFSVIMVTIGLFIRNSYYMNSIFTGGLVSYDQSRKILQPIASEVRSASPSSLGAYALESTTDNSFIFYTDLDNNGTKERVRYYLSGINLMRGVITPTGSPLAYVSNNEVTQVLFEGVRNGSTPIFAYYDNTYTGISSPLTQPVSAMNVRLVKITLILDNNVSAPPSPITVTTQVSIRNLKDNL